MEIQIPGGKVKFLIYWTLECFLLIPMSYMISLIAVLLVFGAFGYTETTEWGSPLAQMLSQIAGGSVIGLGTGFFQKSLLRKMFNVTNFWVYSLVAGFALSELIIGLVLWKLGLNRSELRFLEFKPLPEAMFFAFSGLLIGLLQWTIIRRFFRRAICWVIASVLSWGICIVVVHFAGIYAFFAGALLYGLITGVTLLWVMKARNPDPEENHSDLPGKL
jgi:hypothetical protein